MVENLMHGPYVVTTKGKESAEKVWPRLKRALAEFLAIPAAVVGLFVLLAVVLSAVEHARPAWLQPLVESISTYIFADRDTTGGLLDTVASGLITMVSITISMLLLVLQQTASNMGNLIYDQFFHRYRNEIYIGFIIGSTVFAVLIRSTVSESFQPALGATAAMLFTSAALILFIWFLYTTIEQMRPETVVSEIQSRTLDARKRQMSFIRRTRRQPGLSGPVQVTLRSEVSGFVTRIDVHSIADFLSQLDGQTQVTVDARLGAYVAYGDALATVRAQTLETAREVAERLGKTYVFERERSLHFDPAFGLKQMEMMAWTEVSTSKQNPEMGLRVTYSLRDLLNHWVLEDETEEKVSSGKASYPLPIVYADRLLSEVIDVMESLVIVSSESMQSQCFAALIESAALLFAHLPDDLQQRVEQMVRRALSVMGDHALSCELELAMKGLIQVLEENGYAETAQAVRQATKELAQTVGQLNSRNTRAPQRNSSE